MDSLKEIQPKLRTGVEVADQPQERYLRPASHLVIIFPLSESESI